VVAAEEGEAERAAVLLGAAEASFKALGQIPDPDDATEQETLRKKLANLLSPAAFKAAIEEGSKLSLQDALTDRP
jgi:hypothetical protein